MGHEMIHQEEELMKLCKLEVCNTRNDIPKHFCHFLINSAMKWDKKSITERNKLCLWNTIVPDIDQFQRWPKSKGQISWYLEEDPVTRDAHVQYENSNIYYLYVMTNVIFFKKKVKCQGQKV